MLFVQKKSRGKKLRLFLLSLFTCTKLRMKSKESELISHFDSPYFISW